MSVLGSLGLYFAVFYTLLNSFYLTAKQTFQNREAKKKIQSLEEELNNIKVRREEVRILMNQVNVAVFKVKISCGTRPRVGGGALGPHLLEYSVSFMQKKLANICMEPLHWNPSRQSYRNLWIRQ